MPKRILLPFVLLLGTGCVIAHAQDSTGHRPVRVLPVPALGYAPETDWYVGAVALFTIDPYRNDSTRVSNAKAEFNYTWKHQIISTIAWNFFADKEAWVNRTNLSYMYYPDTYFGIGNSTSEQARSGFTSRRSIAETEWLYNMGQSLFLGMGLRFLDYADVEQTDGSLAFTELRDGRTWGLSQLILRDKRNNLLNAQHGYMYQVRFEENRSTRWYYSLNTDIRYYHSWKDDRLTLAGRVLADMNFGPSPFFDLAILGGDQTARGFFFGRYRDQHLGSLQLESRYTLGWRTGIALFGGGSLVHNDVHDLFNAPVKLNYGAGVRYLVDRSQNINLRLDFGMGSNGSSGFYIAFGESF